MIDWNDKTSLRRRGDKSVRAVEVHLIPDWVDPNGIRYMHHVMWSDGKVVGYLPDGRFLLERESYLDVVNGPRYGDGWITPSKSDGQNRTLYEEQQNADQIHIRWEEVFE